MVSYHHSFSLFSSFRTHLRESRNRRRALLRIQRQPIRVRVIFGHRVIQCVGFLRELCLEGTRLKTSGLSASVRVSGYGEDGV